MSLNKPDCLIVMSILGRPSSASDRMLKPRIRALFLSQIGVRPAKASAIEYSCPPVRMDADPQRSMVKFFG